MPLSFTVNGLGTFTASVTDGSEVYTVVMTGGTATFTAGIAPVGPSGVVAATAPITYDTATKTVAMDTSYFVRSPAVAGTDGQILSWDGATSRPLWISNAAGTVYTTGTNKTGATLAKGTVVYINGAQGSKFTIAKAQASGDATSAQTLGVVEHDISNNLAGSIITFGEITGLNTSAYADGTQLYLSPTTAGSWTSTKPSAPDHLVYVGIVSYSHAINGKILVKIQNGYELEELHNVAIASPTNGQGLIYDSATSLWKNQAIPTPDLSAYLAKADNLSGLANTATARSNLGLGTMAVEAASSYYLASNPSGYITSSALTGYAPLASPTFTGTVQAPTAPSIASGDIVATCGWVKGFGYLVSSDLTPYLTSATAASTYQTISGMSSYAPLASPTFTGDPKAPTPATSDNDTSIATTAFVNAYCPDASTSAAGKVQLATEAQAQAKTSTTTAISPDALLNSHVGWVSAIASPGTAVSTGVVTSQAFGSRCSLTATAANQYAIAYTATGSINTFTTTGTSYSDCNFSKRIKIYGRCYIAPVANLNAYYAFGRSNNTLTTIGSPASKGFGIRIQGTGAVELQVHNGTTLANVTSSFTPTTSQTFDVLIDSLGTGTVNLYINGSLVATSTGGPTGTGAAAFPTLIQEFSSIAASGAGAAWFVEGKAMYFA